MRCIEKRMLCVAVLVSFPTIGGAVAKATDGYRLAAGDVVGVFVEGVVGDIDSTPPVQYPQPESDLPPSIGFPAVVREDGKLSLPLVDPIPVQGLRIEQVEQTVKRAYRGGAKPIVAEDSRIIVTLARKRTIEVTVIRQDTISERPFNFRNGVTDRSDSSARGNRLQLVAGDNDLLTALIETGGIPGINAKPSIRISRKQTKTSKPYQGDAAQPSTRSTSSRSPFPRSSRTLGKHSSTSTQFKSTNNHVSFYRGFHGPKRTEFLVPLSKRSGSQLRRLKLVDGDIIHVDARPTEVYYTGGLLRGGEYPLPRDKQLNVLEAVAIAGVQVGTNGGVAAGSVPPTELLIVRKLPREIQQTFRVDLDRAITDAGQRPAVAAGDTLILRYKPVERATNVGIQIFNAYGTRQLFGR